MEINGTRVLDTFAEAFPTWISRVIITGDTAEWAYRAAVEATGFATSKIFCPCEAGIERALGPHETPDGRAGFAILICAEKKLDEVQCSREDLPVCSPDTDRVCIRRFSRCRSPVLYPDALLR